MELEDVRYTIFKISEKFVEKNLLELLCIIANVLFNECLAHRSVVQSFMHHRTLLFPIHISFVRLVLGWLESSPEWDTIPPSLGRSSDASHHASRWR